MHFLGKSGRKIKVAEIHDNNIGRDASELLRKLKPLSLSLHMMVRFVPLNGRKGRLP